MCAFDKWGCWWAPGEREEGRRITQPSKWYQCEMFMLICVPFIRKTKIVWEELKTHFVRVSHRTFCSSVGNVIHFHCVCILLFAFGFAFSLTAILMLFSFYFSFRFFFLIQIVSIKLSSIATAVISFRKKSTPSHFVHMQVKFVESNRFILDICWLTLNLGSLLYFDNQNKQMNE